MWRRLIYGSLAAFFAFLLGSSIFGALSPGSLFGNIVFGIGSPLFNVIGSLEWLDDQTIVYVLWIILLLGLWLSGRKWWGALQSYRPLRLAGLGLFMAAPLMFDVGSYVIGSLVCQPQGGTFDFSCLGSDFSAGFIVMVLCLLVGIVLMAFPHGAGLMVGKIAVAIKGSAIWFWRALDR